ncbi:hypothetical protein [Bacillus smithii]|nr:hypothetical protein [Bacillus smithii]
MIFQPDIEKDIHDGKAGKVSKFYPKPMGVNQLDIVKVKEL